MTFDLDKEMQNAAQEMNDAEDSLTQMGFPNDQWMLIKKYIFSAITHNQLVAAKAWQTLPSVENPPHERVD